jgi:hypothetical protein
VGWAAAWPLPPGTNLSVEVNVVRNVKRDTALSKPAGLILNDGK